MFRPVLILSLLGVTLLTSCLKKSLDIYTPADSHEYIQLCVQDTGPNCEILWPSVKGLPHDISILIANGDDTEAVTNYAKANGLTLNEFLTSPLRDQYARANIFPVGKLTTGKIATLDGTQHNVECQSDTSCTIDGRFAFHSMPQERTGTVYMTSQLFTPAK